MIHCLSPCLGENGESCAFFSAFFAGQLVVWTARGSSGAQGLARETGSFRKERPPISSGLQVGPHHKNKEGDILTDGAEHAEGAHEEPLETCEKDTSCHAT